MVTKILDKDDDVLRKVAKSVPLSDIESMEIKKVIKNMKEALASQDDGVAIAAPQIGVSLRIFIVSGKVEAINKGEEIKEGEKVPHEDEVYINPKIIKVSKEREDMEEGCLSVRWQYGFVKRSRKATVEAYDEHGKKFTRGASGLLAQIFQHETDHLDGVLFIDKAKNLREQEPPVKS